MGIEGKMAMTNIHLVVLGKLKEKYWQEAEAEYTKRLKPWAKINIHELKEEQFTEKSSPEIIKKKEAEKIMTVLEKIKDAYIIVMDEHGKQFSSTQFADHVNQLHHFHHLIFVIGGPLGLDESILRLARTKLSLSSMTFTHQMARIFLMEQIYRAFMINQNRNYHY